MDIQNLVEDKKFVLLVRESQWGEWVSVFDSNNADDLDKAWEIYTAYQKMFRTVNYGTGKEITMYMDGAPYSGPSIHDAGWKGTGHQCLPKEKYWALEALDDYEDEHGQEHWMAKYFTRSPND